MIFIRPNLNACTDGRSRRPVRVRLPAAEGLFRNKGVKKGVTDWPSLCYADVYAILLYTAFAYRAFSRAAAIRAYRAHSVCTHPVCARLRDAAAAATDILTTQRQNNNHKNIE